MSHGKFGTAINCIDGRTQLPVVEWLKKNYNLDYVDMITEPGADKILSQNLNGKELKLKVLISVEKHNSNVIAIAGHCDCAGNPVSNDEHLDQIRKGIKVITSWNLPVKAIGIWINEKWEAELIE